MMTSARHVSITHMCCGYRLITHIVKLVFNYWQEGSVTTRSNGFYQFCDAMEADEKGRKAPASGWGIDHALKAWGDYWKHGGFYKAGMSGTQLLTSCLPPH